MFVDTCVVNQNIVALFKFYVHPDKEFQEIAFIAGEHACLLRKTALISLPDTNVNENENENTGDIGNGGDINLIQEIEISRIDISNLILHCLQNSDKYSKSIVETGSSFVTNITNKLNPNRGSNSNNNNNNELSAIINLTTTTTTTTRNDENENRKFSKNKCGNILWCECSISESRSFLIIMIFLMIILTIIFAVTGVSSDVYFWTLFIIITLTILIVLFVYWRYHRKYTIYYNETMNKLNLLCLKLNDYHSNNDQYCHCYFEVMPSNNVNDNDNDNINNSGKKKSIIAKSAIIRVVPREKQNVQIR